MSFFVGTQMASAEPIFSEKIPCLLYTSGVVLRPAAQDLYHPLDLILSPDDRVKLPVPGQFRDIPAVSIQGGCGSGTACSGIPQKLAAPQILSGDPHLLPHGRQQVNVHFLGIDACGIQQSGRHAVLFLSLIHI